VLSIVSLGLSGFGATTGVLSLLWNFRQFRLSGYRITVEVTTGVTITTDLSSVTPNINVKVTNTGRMAVTVDGIEIRPADPKIKYAVSWGDWKGTPLPHRLEPNDHKIWRIDDLPGLLEMLQGRSLDHECRAAVLLPNRVAVSEVFTVDPEDAIRALDIQVMRPGAPPQDLLGDLSGQSPQEALPSPDNEDAPRSGH